jgi:chemotaxis protein histidine kinase CheA
MNTALNPKHNDWYEELCALGAIGELSASEFDDLQKHLAECAGCRNLYADFRRVSSEDLGLVAVLKQNEQPAENTDQVPERELLSRVLDRASRERDRASVMSASSLLSVPKRRTLLNRLPGLMIWLRQPTLSYGSLAVILCIGAAIGAYRLREAQLTPTLRGLTTEIEKWKGSAESIEAQEKSTADLLQQSKSEREGLAKELAEARLKYTDSQAREKALESQLSNAQTQTEEKNHELATARSDADDKAKQIADLQTRVEIATARTEDERRIADGLQAKLQAAEQTPPTPESQGFKDADAKELFGARDLHIVDVYDVDTNGQTRRTYGRVYYVEKKLLIFYAFDLEDKKHNRAAAGFQAWGYREANQNKPESLGLFNVDDESANRWVLKVSNPRILERVDAVYVTLEPPNGSPTPRGRRLLYANLVVPPNHP